MSLSLLNQLREMILSGELKAGERITEIELAKQMGVSRTPIRSALPILEANGFIETVGKRGYAVKTFDSDEAVKSLELRAMLEGFAAKCLAETGASQALLDEFDKCLIEGDDIFKKRYLTAEDEERYGAMNARFHDLVVQNCGSPPLISFIEKLNDMPFISPSVLVFDHVGLEQAYDLLFRAHGQHHDLTDAIRNRDAGRAEAVFREHGNAQRQSLFSRINKKKNFI